MERRESRLGAGRRGRGCGGATASRFSSEIHGARGVGALTEVKQGGERGGGGRRGDGDRRRRWMGEEEP